MKNMYYETTDGRGNPERHLVVYMESHDGRPHSVTTLTQFDGEYRYQHHWDFEIDGRNKDGDLIFFEAGSGGANEIEAPHYVANNGGVTCWIHPMVKFRDNKQPINCRVVDKPPLYRSNPDGARHPFVHGDEQPCLDYCNACDAYYGESGCDEHDWCDEHRCFGCDEDDDEGGGNG